MAILVFALYRLVPVSLEAFQQDFAGWHWLLLIINTLLMAYYEGFKGFQRGYSPRVAARARYLGEEGKLLDCLLAPLFCMSFYAAPRRRMIATWILTIFITLMIVLFQYLPQPTRGILDAGVVVGLSWGLIATLVYGWFAINGSLETDPEVQHSRTAAPGSA